MLIRNIFIILWALSSYNSRSQDYMKENISGGNAFASDFNGRPMYQKTEYRIEGTPYYFDEYYWGDVISVSGKEYKNVRIKFNLLEHHLQFITDDGTEMIATSPVKAIRFSSLPAGKDSSKAVTLISGSGVLNAPDAVIYEVLDSGKASLLKKITLSYRDEKKYGEAGITRHFERKENEFFILLNNEYKKVEKKNEFFLTLLHDRSKEIEDFINKNRLNCRSIKDIQQLIRYYNSLF